MRVMVACPTLGNYSEVWILRQIAGFAELGHDLSVLCWSQPGPDPQTFTPAPVTVLPTELALAGGWGRWCSRAANALGRNFVRGSASEEQQITALLNQNKPDVILCHFGHVGLRILPVAKRLKIPVVAHFHGADLSSRLRKRWYRWSLQANAKKFAHLVVVGSHQARLLSSFGVPDDRLSRIPCGVPTDQFDPRPRASREELRFITVSRIVPWKGIEQSIRSFAAVHRQHPNTRLTIVGEGEQMQEMKELADALEVKDVVDFPGSMSAEKVIEQLQQADVFLQHSVTHSTGLCEGFGVSIAEAAAMSLPLVVTNIGGIPDQVVQGETGYLVDEYDVDAMIDAMLELTRSPELRKTMGQAGRRRMIEHFDMVGQISKLEAVLRAAAK